MKNHEFKINPLPPEIDCETKAILKASIIASRKLGELKGEIKKIPNSQILLDTISLQEAKDSNEIENIVTTDDELYKATIEDSFVPAAVKEAQNYTNALKLGMKIIKENKIFRTSDIKQVQKLIEPNHPERKIPGTSLKDAKTKEVIFTPPQDFNEIKDLLSNLEIYINDPLFHDIDPIIKMPIIHYQFESIHPFYDGNGRTGRLLNIIYLVQQQLLDLPVLYLSSYIIDNKSDYYILLQEVRTMGNWNEWILWMLKGVAITAQDTIEVVNKIKILMDELKKRIRSQYSFYSHDLINVLFRHPYTKIDFLSKELSIHRHTATNYLNELASGVDPILLKVKIGRSNYYINHKLLDILKSR